MNPQKENTQTGTLSQVAVYAASAAAGVVTMWATVRENFYRGILNAKWLKGLRDKRNAEYDAIENLTGDAYSAAHKRIGVEYTNNVSKSLEEKGFASTIKKFKFLTVNEKAKVLGIGVTVGAITVGAITNIRQNHQIKQKLEEINRNKEAGTSTGIN